MKNEPVIVERIYNAPARLVWDAITDIDKMKQWYFPMLSEFEPEIGFETVFDVEHDGKIFTHIWKAIEVEPGRKITYEWKFANFPGNSLVTWELFPEGDQTKIILTHKGIETFRGDLHPDLAAQNFTAGWESFIGTKLREFVEQETGE